MKYIILLSDGMADLPVEKLGGKTPMQAADKPNMDRLFNASVQFGLVKTVPDGLTPGSDVANLSVMGYDPSKYYSGRSPLEAISMGIDLGEKDVSLRCNLVTLSGEPAYGDRILVDYCADDISTAEAAELIRAVNEELGSDEFRFYPGISYRHCLVWRNGQKDGYNLTAPHDISGQAIAPYLDTREGGAQLMDLMKRSYSVLKNHPVNKAREANGRRPANSIWLWGVGTKPTLRPFSEKFGIKGAVVSAVDLIKGIGMAADMDIMEVEGATGYLDTNFEGKAAAALRALRKGNDFVYVHVEAPDECGHRKEIDNKVKSIELIDGRLLSHLLRGLSDMGDYRMMILPDHPTPLSTGAHSSDPVPYLLYDSRNPDKTKKNSEKQNSFCEIICKKQGVPIDKGSDLMRLLTEG